MAPSAILERLRKLEARGVIAGYEARLSPKALGLSLLAFVFVKADDRPGSEGSGKALSAIPEVLEVHHIAGEDCYLAKVRAQDPLSLIHLMREKFSKIPNILSTKTTIVLETLKEDNQLPIPKKST